MTTKIVAPLDGVISELGVREGAAFMTGALLFRINGLESVWVNAQIPEAQVHLVPMGATVLARATSWPGESFKGRVQALLPEVDDVSRTFTVRAVLDNANRKLSPGMFVSLDISQPKGQPQLTVPNEAVIATGKRTVVIVAKDVGSFSITDVVTGGSVGDKTLILKGVDEGQSIVLSGQFLIDSEASLTSTIDRLSSATSDTSNDAAAKRPLHLADGIVTSLTKDQITLSHGPVPSLKWGAMTMSFKSPAKGIPADLKQNDRVSFTFFENKEGTFEIDSIAKLNESAPPPPERAP
jgi:Cu(I)/Ag(I) efflux system membrane fusion protein